MFPTRINIDSITHAIRYFLRFLVTWVTNGEAPFENQVRCETNVGVRTIMGVPIKKVVKSNDAQLFLELYVWLTVHRST